jgi:DNA-binding SARP family transcriptional activator
MELRRAWDGQDPNATGFAFSLLGPLRGWRDDQELDLGSPQQRAFLALLLLT